VPRHHPSRGDLAAWPAIAPHPAIGERSADAVRGCPGSRTPISLLGVALPLTIGLGTLLALALSGGSIWLALLVGAALAPTDAALGAGMMANPVVSAMIHRLINVESGLNDEIAMPDRRLIRRSSPP
jgi:NhaP-type Na+/H+ and K+/H+ antiporter